MPTVLYDWPISMASLARQNPKDDRVAERFEIFICAMEIANGFGELTDPVEHRRRFKNDMALKDKLYGQTYPVDEDFIKALTFGMPNSSGIALGFDRLVMLLAGTNNIRDVIAFPKTTSAASLMDEAPSSVSDEQLVDLNISIIPKGD